MQDEIGHDEQMETMQGWNNGGGHGQAIAVLVARELPDDPDEVDGFAGAAEAMARLWDIIFSDSSGKIYDELDGDNIHRITRNFLVVTQMVRPDRMVGAQTLRALGGLLGCSHETLNRIQLRIADSLRFHSRCQRKGGRTAPVKDRIAKHKNAWTQKTK